MSTIHTDQAQARDWQRLFMQFLWLSVALTIFAAILVTKIVQGEDAKLLASGFFGFGVLGVAFGRAVRRLKQPRWWHWMLGALLITPALLFVMSIGVGG